MWKCTSREFTPELIRALLVHAQFNAVFNNYTDIKKKMRSYGCMYCVLALSCLQIQWMK